MSSKTEKSLPRRAGAMLAGAGAGSGIGAGAGLDANGSAATWVGADTGGMGDPKGSKAAWDFCPDGGATTFPWKAGDGLPNTFGAGAAAEGAETKASNPSELSANGSNESFFAAFAGCGLSANGSNAVLLLDIS